MEHISKVLPAIVVLLCNSCTGSRNLAEEANLTRDAYQSGEYFRALESAERIISKKGEKGKKAEGQIYAIAGKTAYQLEAYDNSREYLIKAREMGNWMSR